MKGALRINRFEFFRSFAEPGKFSSDSRPEIAFLGRSNVGKSSVINRLLGSSNVALTSKRPGRTCSANYFLIDNRFYFVDMPGYGYAKLSKKEKRRLHDILSSFLAREDNPKGIALVIDVRHGPSEDDREMLNVLGSSGRRFCLVFNKVDKISKGSLGKNIATYLESFTIEGQVGLIPFSCISGEGKRELLAWISDTLSL